MRGRVDAATTAAFWGCVAAENEAKSTIAIAAITTHTIASTIGNTSLRASMVRLLPLVEPYAEVVTAFHGWFQAPAETPSSSSARKAGSMCVAHSSYPSALGWKPSEE